DGRGDRQPTEARAGAEGEARSGWDLDGTHSRAPLSRTKGERYVPRSHGSQLTPRAPTLRARPLHWRLRRRGGENDGREAGRHRRRGEAPARRRLGRTTRRQTMSGARNEPDEHDNEEGEEKQDQVLHSYD